CHCESRSWAAHPLGFPSRAPFSCGGTAKTGAAMLQRKQASGGRGTPAPYPPLSAVISDGAGVVGSKSNRRHFRRNALSCAIKCPETAPPGQALDQIRLVLWNHPLERQLQLVRLNVMQSR